MNCKSPNPQPRYSRRRWLSTVSAAGLGMMGGAGYLRAAIISRYRDRILTKKPVGYWRLGEAAGVPIAQDASGNGHHGTYRGTPQLGAPGAVKHDEDTSITLDGKSSYVEIPDHPDFSVATSGKGITVETWMRPDALTFEGDTKDPFIHWLAKGDPGQAEWALRFYSLGTSRPNRISAYIFNLAGGLGSGAYFEDPLTAGEWMHVVACFDPVAKGNVRAGVAIYRNGVLRKGPALPGSPGTLYSEYQVEPIHGTGLLRLGTRDLKHFLTGGLDEVAIYPRVLTAAEVREHWLLGSKG